MVTCLLLAVAAGPGVAQGEITEEGAPDQRIEIAEAGISVAFPATWSAVTRMVLEGAQLPPESGASVTTDVWVVREAADRIDGGCDLGTYLDHPLSFEEHAQWVGRYQAKSSDVVPAIESTAVELPAGAAVRFDLTFTDGGFGAAYLLESDEARYQLRCVGSEQPADGWRSIAESIAFTPSVPMDNALVDVAPLVLLSADGRQWCRTEPEEFRLTGIIDASVAPDGRVLVAGYRNGPGVDRSSGQGSRPATREQTLPRVGPDGTRADTPMALEPARAGSRR